jgi:hypothetical protein
LKKSINDFRNVLTAKNLVNYFSSLQKQHLAFQNVSLDPLKDMGQ